MHSFAFRFETYDDALVTLLFQTKKGATKKISELPQQGGVDQQEETGTKYLKNPIVLLVDTQFNVRFASQSRKINFKQTPLLNLGRTLANNKEKSVTNMRPC